VDDAQTARPQCALAIEEEVVRLYEEHSGGLFRYAFVLARNREASQDAVQEAFLRYFIERSGGRSVERPKAWLFLVLRNLVLDALKASSLRKSVDLSALGDYADANQNPESGYQLAEISRCMWELLSPRELECVRLRAEGLRYDEVAEVLGLRSGTVGALLARVQKKMRKAAGALDRRCMLAQSEIPHAP